MHLQHFEKKKKKLHADKDTHELIMSPPWPSKIPSNWMNRNAIAIAIASANATALASAPLNLYRIMIKPTDSNPLSRISRELLAKKFAVSWIALPNIAMYFMSRIILTAAFCIIIIVSSSEMMMTYASNTSMSRIAICEYIRKQASNWETYGLQWKQTNKKPERQALLPAPKLFSFAWAQKISWLLGSIRKLNIFVVSLDKRLS